MMSSLVSFVAGQVVTTTTPRCSYLALTSMLVWLISVCIRGPWVCLLRHGLKIASHNFLHDRSWISPWIKSISNELDITCHVLASQLPGHCDVIANRLWRHQQNVKRSSETRGWCVKILGDDVWRYSSVILVFILFISLVAVQVGK